MAILLWFSSCAAAQPIYAQSYTAGADLFFYGDNTEFTNPFQSGETILGISGRLFLEATLNETVTVRGGVFGLGRFGAHEFLEHAEPAVALQLSRGTSRFIFGSLETIALQHDVDGPDQETLHRLLPPLQQETLAFTRGQEMGLQWLVDAARIRHDAWINWQRLNTAEQRERFDAGYRAAVSLGRGLQAHGQWHLVHEGGQQFQTGAVSDSQGAALGLQWSFGVRRMSMAIDGHAVATRHVPNRADAMQTDAGLGGFLRAAVTHGAWRGHALMWRGHDTYKAEGDPQYHVLQRDGLRFRAIRDYAEIGLTRHFRPAPGVHMFAAFRMHRIESHYEYSYRIVGRVRLRHKF